jgi:hypothetical protein
MESRAPAAGREGAAEPRSAAGSSPEQELIAHLQVALGSRQLVGQASGVLVATHRISAERAWHMLSGVSQHTNIKVVRLAAAVVGLAAGAPVADDAARKAVLRHLLPERRQTAARSGVQAAAALSADDRDLLAIVRDKLAQERDAAADSDDHRAAVRDATAGAREIRTSGGSPAGSGGAADDRAAAARDRRRARADRRAAATERALAAEDRHASTRPSADEAAAPPPSG